MPNTYLVRRDPFRELDSLVRYAFGPTVRTASVAADAPGFHPAADSHRDGDDAVIRLELPGVDVEQDVTVEVARRRLVVKGERRDVREDATDGRRGSEIRYGSFQRSFRLGGHVSGDDVTASYDAGVLTVRVRGAFAETPGHRVAITTGDVAAAAGEPDEQTQDGQAA